MHVIIIIARQQIYMGLNESGRCHLEELVCNGVACVGLLWWWFQFLSAALLLDC